MSIKKKILYSILVVLVVIQFIQPTKNISSTESANNIKQKYNVPADVEEILKTSCYDCHSNNTVYPWYTSIQPVGWWMQNHVNEGKDELNFSEFAAYSDKRAHHKFKEIIEQIKEGEMPIYSYTLVHGNAKLNDEQKQKLISWADELRRQMNMPEEPERRERRD